MCNHLNPHADMLNISPERHNIINLGSRECVGFRSPCPCAWIMTARMEKDDCQGLVCVCRGFSVSSNLALGLCRKQMSNKWPDSLCHGAAMNTEASEVCSLDDVLGSFVNHCSVFLAFVDNGSHCGSLESPQLQKWLCNLFSNESYHYFIRSV